MESRRVDYRSWLYRVLAWDGLLPLCIALAPNAVEFLLPKNRDAIAVTAVAVPLIAFLLRVRAGNRHIASNGCSRTVRFLQSCVFVLAILALIVFDCLIILAHALPGGLRIDRDDLLGLAIFFAVYLTLMAIAMYPGRTTAASSDSELLRDNGPEQ